MAGPVTPRACNPWLSAISDPLLSMRSRTRPRSHVGNGRKASSNILRILSPVEGSRGGGRGGGGSGFHGLSGGSGTGVVVIGLQRGSVRGQGFHLGVPGSGGRGGGGGGGGGGGVVCKGRRNTSTRRFRARPSGLRLSPTGHRSPSVSGIKVICPLSPGLSASMAALRAFCTSIARRPPRLLL